MRSIWTLSGDNHGIDLDFSTTDDGNKFLDGHGLGDTRLTPGNDGRTNILKQISF